MTLPGSVVAEQVQQIARTSQTDTGTLFVVGLFDRGPITPVLCEAPQDVADTFGGNISYGVAPAYVETAFAEGLSKVYIRRVVGDAALPATVTLDGLVINASSAGAWANGYEVAAVAGVAGGTFVLVVTDPDDVEVERSPDLADLAAAVAWSASSEYIRVVSGTVPTPLPAAAAPLASGTDDRASLVEADYTAALADFVSDFGPGQVAIPGLTTSSAHIAIATHAKANNRRGLGDLALGATVSARTAVSATTRANSDLGKYIALFANWASIPGITPGTARQVPWSAVVAGHVAALDALGNPNVAAAGVKGRSTYATGIDVEFSDSDRETLNDAGINVARVRSGELRTYGFRTVADPDEYPLHWQFSNVRLDMAITARAADIAESHVFAQIDGEGIEAGRFGGKLSAMLAEFRRVGALYGATDEDAYDVEVGASVNTPANIAAGLLSAVITCKRSPMAERVRVVRVTAALDSVI